MTEDKDIIDSILCDLSEFFELNGYEVHSTPIYLQIYTKGIETYITIKNNNQIIVNPYRVPFDDDEIPSCCKVLLADPHYKHKVFGLIHFMDKSDEYTFDSNGRMVYLGTDTIIEQKEE